MKTTERYTGTVEHDGVPAHDCRRITDVNRKTSLTFCSRCGDWFEPASRHSPDGTKDHPPQAASAPQQTEKQAWEANAEEHAGRIQRLKNAGLL